MCGVCFLTKCIHQKILRCWTINEPLNLTLPKPIELENNRCFLILSCDFTVLQHKYCKAHICFMCNKSKTLTASSLRVDFLCKFHIEFARKKKGSILEFIYSAHWTHEIQFQENNKTNTAENMQFLNDYSICVSISRLDLNVYFLYVLQCRCSNNCIGNQLCIFWVPSIRSVRFRKKFTYNPNDVKHKHIQAQAKLNISNICK